MLVVDIFNCYAKVYDHLHSMTNEYDLQMEENCMVNDSYMEGE